jgi:secreted PhoX family phosphatase
VSRIDRRQFFRNAATLSGAALFAPSLDGLASWNALSAEELSYQLSRRSSMQSAGGYGELVQSITCPEFWIPKDFNIVRLSETFTPSRTNAEFLVPAAVDGMAAFALPNGNVRLIRNHEIGDEAVRAKPIGQRPYDARAGGGTTSLEVQITGKGNDLAVTLLREFPSLCGTLINCAGGGTPWGSWLSCEETTLGTAAGYEKPHGYVFEVPVIAGEEVEPVPLKAMGRFEHEALAVDPNTRIVYMTEDCDTANRPGSGFYRFIPNRADHLTEGCKLQMLAVRDKPNYNTENGQTPGVALPVYWVDIDEPEPPGAEANSSTVFMEGASKGGARFQRLEGVSGVTAACTSIPRMAATSKQGKSGSIVQRQKTVASCASSSSRHHATCWTGRITFV